MGVEPNELTGTDLGSGALGSEPREADETGRSPLRLVLVVTAMVLATIAAIAVPYLLSRDDDSSTTWSYVIPAGTGERLDAGEQVVIVPSELDVRVGDVISIVNNDDRDHTVGPFYVPAGQQLSHEFTEPGTIADVCTVHPSGRVTITVT